MDIMPDGKEISSCFWGSSNVNGYDPRSLPARLLFVPVLGVPTRLRACVDDAAVREVRGWPRMSPSRSRCALIFILYACTASLSCQIGAGMSQPTKHNAERLRMMMTHPHPVWPAWAPSEAAELQTTAGTTDVALFALFVAFLGNFRHGQVGSGKSGPVS
jgi:hypothetical protein